MSTGREWETTYHITNLEKYYVYPPTQSKPGKHTAGWDAELQFYSLMRNL